MKSYKCFSAQTEPYTCNEHTQDPEKGKLKVKNLEIRWKEAEDWRLERKQNRSDNKKSLGKMKRVPNEETDWYNMRK